MMLTSELGFSHAMESEGNANQALRAFLGSSDVVN